MGVTPHYTRVAVDDRVIHIQKFIGGSDCFPGCSCLIKSTVTDSGSSPTTRIRRGLVIVLKTSDGLFYRADDAAAGADRNGVASAVSLVALGAGSASKTFKYKYKGGAEATITMAAGDDTAAEVVTALNADTEFARNLIASQAANVLTIKTKKAGADEYFEITDGTLNDQAGVDQDTFLNNTTKFGTDADYRVVERMVDMLNPASGVVYDAEAETSLAAYYDESQLLGLTAEARVVLSRRGAIFG